MKNLKYTPGPWKYTISKIHGTHQISQGSSGSQICKMWMRGNETTSANARLISCAPEMLKELLLFKSEICGRCGCSPCNKNDECGYIMRIIKLIEKATELKIEEVTSYV